MHDDLPPELLDKLRPRLRGAPEFDTEAMLARLDERIDRAARKERRRAKFDVFYGPTRNRWRWAWAATAAVIVVAATINLVKRPTAGTQHPIPSAVYQTARGEQRRLQLADGSEVVLAPATRLTVSEGYGQGQRTVTLDGQAISTVRHDDERPFRVRTARAVIEDLGTEFDIRAYMEEKAPRVIVASGTVLFRTERDSAPVATVLQRNQMARLAPDGTVHVRRDIDASALLGWAQGELAFDDAPLEQVARELGRWYAVEIRLGDTRTRAQRLTATFRRSSLSQALAVITQSLDLEASRDSTSHTITLRSKNRSN